MGQMTNPKPLIIIIWACQEMMAWMRMVMGLIGSMDVICHLVGLWLKSWAIYITADFLSSPHHINLIQHDSSHGPDDQPKTIDHHHLGMSRDDVMDEHGIDCMYECHLA
jgi:hypothetical protein